jgi:hypothetical protein
MDVADRANCTELFLLCLFVMMIKTPAIICHVANIVLIASECGSKIHIYASCQHQVIIKYSVHGVYKCTQLRNSYYVLDDSEKIHSF